MALPATYDLAVAGELAAVKAALGLAGPLPRALRQVATACAAPTYGDSSAASFLSFSPHVICEDVDGLAIETPNFWINSGSGFVESPAGSAMTVAAWIEYPRGVFAQCTYSGAATGALASGGRILSDVMPVKVPRGAAIRVWQRVIGAGAGRVLYTAGNANSFQNGGEGCLFSGVTGSTVPPVNASGLDSSTCFRPSAILGYSTRKAVLVVQDSRGGQVGDKRSGGNGDVGEICRGLGVYRPVPVPYIAYGNAGHSVSALVAMSAGNRAHLSALAAYCSEAIIQLGINDVVGGIAAATVLSQMATVRGYLAGITRSFLSTKPPVSTSTDSWATTANQTTHANNAIRNTLNDSIRSYPAGWSGYFEVADHVESARNSGLWKAPLTTGPGAGSGPWTADGTHLIQFSNEFLRDNLAVNPALFQ